MKIKLLFKYILLVVLIATLNNCQDDEFLKENPETFYTTDNAFSSPEQVDQVNVYIYSMIREMMCNKWTLAVTLKGKGTDMVDVPQIRLNTSFSDYSAISPERSEFRDIFNFWYQVIATANTALYATELEHIKWSSTEDKSYAIAQAKFFRAYAYRNLGELFGGVPLVDKIENTPRYDYQRSSRVETYQFAIDDLESAIDDLPVTTEEGGRIVKGAAQHYLSELYLAMGTEMEQTGTGDFSSMYTKAIEYASQVINGGTYSLMTERFGARSNEANKNVWWDLFRINNVNYQDGNNECIWAWQIDFDAYKAGDKTSYIQYPRDFGPILRFIPGVDGTAEDVGGRGVAFVVPTMYTRDTIWSGKLANDMRNDECNIQRTIYYNDPAYPDLIGKPVPYSVMYQDDYFKSSCFPLFYKTTTDKFVGLDQGENRSNLFRDDYAIRLPETILLRAEAYLRKGDLQNAANDINLIRDRAECTYRVSANDVDLDFILDERARELYTEECRWNTLLRMGGTVAVDRIRKYAYWPETKATLTFNYNLWPIPQSVIDRNKDVKLEQNPGWN